MIHTSLHAHKHVARIECAAVGQSRHSATHQHGHIGVVEADVVAEPGADPTSPASRTAAGDGRLFGARRDWDPIARYRLRRGRLGGWPKECLVLIWHRASLAASGTCIVREASAVTYLTQIDSQPYSGMNYELYSVSSLIAGR